MKRTLLLMVAVLTAGAFSQAAAQKLPPATTRPSPVAPQAAQPSAPSGAVHSAGLAMPPYAGSTPEAAAAYAGRFVHLLDSTIVTLVGIFRNTSGQPVIGAPSPATLSQRERDRWMRCRELYWDLTTYATAVTTLRQILPAASNVQLKVTQLDSAFGQSTATAECDNIASMIAAPNLFASWGASYERAARHFYRDFYPQVRNIHEAARALIFALTGLPQRMPPALPQSPPYAGAAPE